jgi:YHS domain-containing protein
MFKTLVTPVIAGVFALGLVTAAVAAKGEAKGEFDNLCTQGLAQNEKVETDCSVNAQYQGKTYCFGNEQARDAFMKDPAANLAKAEAYYESIKKG